MGGVKTVDLSIYIARAAAGRIIAPIHQDRRVLRAEYTYLTNLSKFFFDFFIMFRICITKRRSINLIFFPGCMFLFFYT